MSTSVYPPPLYTDAQATFLAIIPYFTAPWSVAGSSLILWSIWYDRKELLKHVYHRIMVGISFFDWMSSMGLLIFGPWAVPSDWPYGRSGRGTVGTCEASGFFLNLSFGAMWYTVFLAIHFVMLLRWEWKERRIACCLEPLAHLVGWIIPISSSSGGIASRVFNPRRDLPGWCWFSDNPPLCNENDDIDCVRGEDYDDFTGIIETGNVIFAWTIIIICMLLIVCKVRRIERNMGRYAVGRPDGRRPRGRNGRGESSNTIATAASTAATSPTASRGNEPSYARTKATARQALLYIAIFFVIYSPMTLILQMKSTPDDPDLERKRKLPVALLVKICTPLQGFLNALVYFRRWFADLIKDGKSLAFMRQIPYLGPWIEEWSSRGTGSSSRRGRPGTSGQTLDHAGRYCANQTTITTLRTTSSMSHDNHNPISHASVTEGNMEEHPSTPMHPTHNEDKHVSFKDTDLSLVEEKQSDVHPVSIEDETVEEDEENHGDVRVDGQDGVS